MLVGEPVKLRELTRSPRRERRAAAEQTHFGDFSTSSSVPLITPSASPRKDAAAGSPFSSSLQRDASTHTKTGSKQTSWKRRAPRLVLVLLATSCAVVPLLMASNGQLSVVRTPGPPGSDGATQTSASVPDRCRSHSAWGATADRLVCSSLLESPTGLRDKGWVVGIHIDRAPVLPSNTRGGRVHRKLPHQYFIRALEATLDTLSHISPQGEVDLVVFSDDRWGGIVDETGLPVDWDVAGNACAKAGLSCKKHLVLLNEDLGRSADAVECLASADVMVASEHEISRAAASLSSNVRLLTDEWELDDDEDMVVVNPAVTIAGMTPVDRARLDKVMRDRHDCWLP